MWHGALTPAPRQVRIEAAFSTLRLSATVDEHVDWSSLELLRELGHGARIMRSLEPGAWSLELGAGSAGASCGSS